MYVNDFAQNLNFATARTLDATYDLARDTEETGISALGELVRQREVLEGAQDDVHKTKFCIDLRLLA
jgi:hypothetical protein